jgi:hypothetical protein
MANLMNELEKFEQEMKDLRSETTQSVLPPPPPPPPPLVFGMMKSQLPLPPPPPPVNLDF